MGRELPPDAARLRVATDTRLVRLSASASAQPASPAGSPLRGARPVPAAPPPDVWPPGGPASGMAADGAANAAAAIHHQLSSASLGSSSDQASPRFLELLRSSLPGPDEEGDAGDSGSGAPSSGGGSAHRQPAGTLAALHALNGAAAGSSKPQAAGGKHKRGLLGMFRSGGKNGKHSGQQQQQPAAEPAAGKRKGGSWFGSKSPEATALGAAAGARPPVSPPAQPSAQHSAPPSAVLLPGLPLATAHSGGSASTASDEAPAGAGMRGGRPASAPALSASSAADAWATDPTAPTSTAASPVTAGLPPGEANGKKGHRRHRSLTSMLVPGWRRRSRQASAGSEAELGGDVTPTRGTATPARPATPGAELGGEGEGGMPGTITEEPAGPRLPAGTTGLRNIGNTCFVNAALQCLRYTPGLPLAVAPDLPARAARRAGGEAAGGAGEEEPAAGEEVHAQAMARASMDMRAPAAIAAAALPGQPAGAGEEAGGTAAARLAAADVPPEAAAAGEAATEVAPEAAPAGGETAAEGSPEAAPGGAEPAAAQPADAASGDGAAPQQQQPAPAPQKPQRPQRGELLSAFSRLVSELYLPAAPGAVCATPLLRTLRAFPIAADYFDGGQHDCQEVLRVMMDLLHDDLNRVPPRQPAQPPAPTADAQEAQGGAEADAQQQGQAPAADPPQPPPEQQQQGREQQQQQQGGEAAQEEAPGGEAAPEEEAAKADRLWRQYLERDDSLITDLFGGQLQSSVTCHKCGGRFTMYEPFWDLSLPLAKESKGGSFSWLGLKGSSPATIQDCLTAFAADEKMEGAEAFHCERCKDKTAATKHLRLHRLPEVLVLHIKRFKYKGASTDKLATSVSFPLTGLRLHQFASPECPAGPDECSYDLFAVSNHYGNLSGGHYTAMCRVPGAGEGAWYSFNDEQVTRVSPNQVVSQYAYILFYVRTRSSSAAHHRRNLSAASAGAAGQ